MAVTNGNDFNIIRGIRYAHHQVRWANSSLFCYALMWAAVCQQSSKLKQITKEVEARKDVTLAVWLSGNVLASINVVVLHQTRLVLGWVTICGRVNHFGM